MISTNFSHPDIERPFYILLELLIELFALGIFSGRGGAKAWFELILVTAALCSSGFILWWQIPLLIVAIILATLSAGVFAVLAPQYLEVEDVKACNQIASTLETISQNNVNKILALSGNELEEGLSQLDKARKIFESNPELVEQILELQSISNIINQTCQIVSVKVEAQQKAKEKFEREESERRKSEWETYEKKLRQDEKLKQQQEDIKQKSKNIADRKAAEQKSAWLAWLREQRRRENFTGGCPPDNRYDPPRCRPGYPIKVTLNRKEDGFDGIIWEPTDTEYNSIKPRWCYKTVQEAQHEMGKYRFRRPLDNQGRPRPSSS